MKLGLIVLAYLAAIVALGFIGEASRDWLGSRDGNLILLGGIILVGGIAYAIWVRGKSRWLAQLVFLLTLLVCSTEICYLIHPSAVYERAHRRVTETESQLKDVAFERSEVPRDSLSLEKYNTALKRLTMELSARKLEMEAATVRTAPANSDNSSRAFYAVLTLAACSLIGVAWSLTNRVDQRGGAPSERGD